MSKIVPNYEGVAVMGDQLVKAKYYPRLSVAPTGTTLEDQGWVDVGYIDEADLVLDLQPAGVNWTFHTLRKAFGTLTFTVHEADRVFLSAWAEGWHEADERRRRMTSKYRARHVRNRRRRRKK